MLCLVSCVFIYLLVDLFDRLDNFLNKATPFHTIISYFLWKIPVIISQIFPMVFFLTLIVQLTVMKKNREWEALEGGGIFFGHIVVFILVYSIFFSLVQLVFSQYLGTMAKIKTGAIWDSLGKKHTKQRTIMKDFWFRKGMYIGHMGFVNTKTHIGKKIVVYKMDKGFSKIKLIIYGQEAKVAKKHMDVFNCVIYVPGQFNSTQKKEFKIDSRDMDTIFDLTPSKKLEDVSLWKLKGIIKELQNTGTNVEEILTIWYGKIAYSFSIVFLSLFAVILSRIRDNLPINLAIGLCVSLVFYGLFVLGSILGKHGVVSPIVGAWGGNFIFGTWALYYMFVSRG